MVYFLPRIFILFLNPIENISAAGLISAGEEWETANYLRLAMVFATMVAYLLPYRKVGSALSRR